MPMMQLGLRDTDLVSGSDATGCRTPIEFGRGLVPVPGAIIQRRQHFAIAQRASLLRVRLPLSTRLRDLARVCLAIFTFVLFGASLCRAQGTYTAASCAESDVNAVINGPTHKAANGDTVIIPSGTCTWTSGITISGVGIGITGTGTPNAGGGTFGAGAANTTLTETGTSPFFSFTGLTFGQTAKVEMLKMSTTNTTQGIGGPVTFSGSCTASGCAQIRADNLTFTTGQWAAALAGGFVLVGDVFGVVDHNTASESSGTEFLVQISYDAWQGVGAFGDNSFASPGTFGTAQAMYMENNNVSGIRLSENDVSPPGVGPGGGRWVCRFNQLPNMPGDGICGAHGTAWGGRFRGMRQVEAYYNTASSGVCDVLDGLLSGTGRYFSNTMTGTGCNAMTELDIARFAGTGAPWNSCNGTQPWDYAPWSSTTPCLDQPGSGADTGFQNSTPVLVTAPGAACTTVGQCWPNPVLDPVYEAGEVSPNNAPGVVVASDGSQTRLLANRDYYGQISDVANSGCPGSCTPFTGASGTGYGTLSQRPTTCTPHVGYWATDTGTWNTFNSQQGTLYICSATNTWSVGYTPYTYPHPLTAGGTSTTGPNPDPPTALTATVQ
jgi:hypothetical protein